MFDMPGMYAAIFCSSLLGYTWHDQVFNFLRGAQLSMGTLTIVRSGIRFGIARLAASVESFFQGGHRALPKGSVKPPDPRPGRT